MLTLKQISNLLSTFITVISKKCTAIKAMICYLIELTLSSDIVPNVVEAICQFDKMSFKLKKFLKYEKSTNEVATCVDVVVVFYILKCFLENQQIY